MTNSKVVLVLLAFLPFTALSLIITHTASANNGTICTENFPSSCFCGITMYDGTSQYVVNCTGTGLRNISVLEFMPEQVQVLIFTGNNIPELPWNVFGSINKYKNLKIVDMSNNNIREIRGKSYHHVQNVERLILNHNNLSISRNNYETNYHHPRVFSNFVNLESLHMTNAFDDKNSPQLSQDLHDIFVNSQLVKLKKLHLEQNKIKYFSDRKIFCDLPNLSDLHLGDNFLKEINFEVACLEKLRFLDLQRNKFEYVNSRDLIALNNINKIKNDTNLIIDLNLNPFVCDCRIAPFYNWLSMTNITVRNKHSIVCFYNKIEPQLILKANFTSCISTTEIGIENFQIMSTNTIIYSDTVKGNEHSFALIFFTSVLCTITVLSIIALVYINRYKVKFIFPSLINDVIKNVQYTTIANEEWSEVYV